MATPTKPSETPPIEEPFPIFTLANRYLLYDIDTVSHVRRSHNISGVLIGGLAQAPQQNVFLGLPLELMPEEARLLVEKGVAYVVDDVAAHKRGFLANALSAEEKRAFWAALRKQGVRAANEAGRRTDERARVARAKRKEQGKDVGDWNDIPDDMLRPRGANKMNGVSREETPGQRHNRDEPNNDTNDDDQTLFSSTSTLRQTPTPSSTLSDPTSFAITPTTSHPPLPHPSPSSTPHSLPLVPRSYPIFKHLHNSGYFLAPGLRFGCQYMAYPGDPLRFHSHFLVNGLEWDEEFALLDLVGGGRLGTGVKKGFLVGGESGDEVGGGGDGSGSGAGMEPRAGGVRAFCVEWGGM